MDQVLQDAVEGLKKEAQQQQWRVNLADYLEKIGSLEDYEKNLNKIIETNKKNADNSQAELDKAKDNIKQKFDTYKSDLDKQVKDAEAALQSAKDENKRILNSANNQATLIIADAKKRQKAIEDKIILADGNLTEKARKLTAINEEIFKRNAILEDMKSRMAKLNG